jgi:hypothetical protein
MSAAAAEISRLHWLTKLATIGSGAACVLAIGWVILIGAPAMNDPGPLAPPPKPVALASSSKALNVAAFDAPIWNPTPPPKVVAPPPPPPPLRLQLLAITRTSTSLAAEMHGPRNAGEQPSYRATLYDPDADAIIEARAGEMVQGRKVAKVTASSIELIDPTGNRTLSLDTVNRAGVP